MSKYIIYELAFKSTSYWCSLPHEYFIYVAHDFTLDLAH